MSNGALGGKPLGLNPFSLKPGNLTITATPAPPELRPLLFNKTWMSGLLESKFLYTYTYGYIDVVADLPVCTHGTWPAIWTTTLTGWPKGGEIDFPEDIGTGAHWFSIITPANKAKSGDHSVFKPPEGCARGWHHYGALKTPTTVALYYDGHKVGQFPATPDMNVPHQIILNLAVGGGWATNASGKPDLAPVTASFASVKVWELK